MNGVPSIPRRAKIFRHTKAGSFDNEITMRPLFRFAVDRAGSLRVGPPLAARPFVLPGFAKSETIPQIDLSLFAVDDGRSGESPLPESGAVPRFNSMFARPIEKFPCWGSPASNQRSRCWFIIAVEIVKCSAGAPPSAADLGFSFPSIAGA